jgi:hypothetical protein
MNAGDDYLAELGNRPAARPPASIGEIWSAEWTRSGLDTIGGLGHPLAEASDDLAQAVSVAAGKDWREYAEEKGTPLASISPFAEDRIGLLNRLADTLPEEKQKELAPLRDVHARAADKAQKIERNASDVAAGAYGLSGIATSFLAGIARQSVDPANLIAGAATAPLGGPFAGSAVKVIARQAAAGGLAQAAVEPYIVSARQELGLETHALEDIGQAALGAAGIAGIFRAGAWGMRVAGRAARGEELFPPKPAGPTAGQQVADLLRSYTPDRLQGALDRVIGPAELDAAATLADRDRLIAQATAGQAQGELRLRETIAALEEGRPPPLGVAQVDNLYRQALDLVRTEKNASTSFVQRKLGLDYNDAVAIMTRLEREGVIATARVRCSSKRRRRPRGARSRPARRRTSSAPTAAASPSRRTSSSLAILSCHMILPAIRTRIIRRRCSRAIARRRRRAPGLPRRRPRSSPSSWAKRRPRGSARR